METTERKTTDFLSAFEEVNQSLLVARACGKSAMNEMPTDQSAEDAGLLVIALIDQLDHAIQNMEYLMEIYYRETRSQQKD